MSKKVVEIQDNDFEQTVLGQERPIIVDFWAPWCGPCKAMGPLFESLAETYGDEMIFAKCNVDDSQAVAGRLGIKSIPTLKIFKNGKAVHSVTGMVSKNGLEEAIKKVLAGEETESPFTVL